MTPALSTLFTPQTFGSLTVPTRWVMAPMTRERSPGGIPGEDVLAYYERRARYRVGLIVTEGVGIPHPSAVGGAGVPRLYEEEPLAAWQRIVNAVHAAGGRIVPQLWHQGFERKHYDHPHPEARSMGPSGYNGKGELVGEPMSEADIQSVIAAFAEGAATAKKLGFDGIEIHGAHGYLLDQFFWAMTNRRTDLYGGSLVARTRLAAEVVRACRQAVGADFPIILRISQWKVADYEAKLAKTPEELASFLTPLAEAGVDIFHGSTRRFWELEFAGSELNFPGWIKKLTGKPVITVGSVGNDLEELKEFLRGKRTGASSLEKVLGMIERNEVDLVALGRQILADPEWVAKVETARVDELQPVPKDVDERLY